MNRVATRALILLLLVAGLLAGTGFFVAEYAMKADRWVMSAGTPQTQQEAGIELGTVTDRNGRILLQLDRQRVYDGEEAVRSATVHWLGDRSGNIPSSIITHYTKELLDYSKLTGTYHYGEGGGLLSMTLDARIQAVAQNAMAGKVGTVAVYDYRTGALVCALTTPNYDPDHMPDLQQELTGAYEGVFVNRFMRAAYIPGSIFKIVTLAAALETDPALAEQTFECTGSFEAGSGTVTCLQPHGVQTLKEAFCNSCNCAFGQLTLSLGKQTMTDCVEAFGVLERVSFDGLSSVAGNYDVSDAGSESFAWSGIGQHTDLVNPCAFLQFMGAVAGGGVGAKPYVVQQVQVDGHSTYEAQTAYTEQVLSAQTAAVLKEYMANNVQSKYGAENFPGLAVCAKSGTGEVGGGKKPNAMFAGFVDDPTLPLAFVVCIEQGGYGADTCVPVINQILQACRQYLS